MSDFITVLMAAAAFIFIAYPLLVKRPFSETASRSGADLEDLYSQRNTTYSMLKELEFDHSSGILTDEDFKALESRYKNKAVNILKEIDGQAAGGELEDEIEREVRRLRGKPVSANVEDEAETAVRQFRSRRQVPAPNSGSLDDDIEAQIAGFRSSHQTPKPAPAGRGSFCPQCGARFQAQDRFCRQCGAKLD